MADPLESSTTATATSFADDFLADFEPGLSPAEEEGEEEEELEWMKSFPPLDTFLTAAPAAPPPPPARSPVSVLPLAPPMNLPARARSKIRRRKRRVFSSVSVAAEISVRAPAPVLAPWGKLACLHCGSETTPQWRAGPMGPKTLCNACGVRYKSGRLLPEYRPACSPTFVSHVHSNSHRKVLEMRRKKETLESQNQNQNPDRNANQSSLVLVCSAPAVASF